ncbi:titin homolog [Ptychodera flava]|uniref:titin homolog n=1 Tax=Ptychodera flava TaxID=63121 RepID=UPI003969D241
MEGSAALIVTSWKSKSSCPAIWKIITDFCEHTLKEKSELSAVYCTVLVELSEEQREDAARHGVTLMPARRPKWSKPDEDPPAIHWLLNHNNYYPGLAKLEGITHVVGLSAKTHNAASAIHESLFKQAKLLQVPSQPAVLFVGHSWNKDELGLTEFHITLVQDFCERKANAGEDLKAYSTVLDVKISDAQKKDAESCGVTLIPAQRKEGIGPKDDPSRLEWLLSHEIHYPDLGDLENIQYVVGYAPKTGQAAADIRKKHFRGAKLVLINHARPEPNCLQAEEYGMSEFAGKMLQMASEADILFSIGPYIYDYFKNAYRAEVQGRDLSDIPHEEILPRPNKCFWVKNPKEVEVTQHHILTCGQMDTQEAIERYKPIATSVGTAANLQKAHYRRQPEWKIQGVSKEAGKNELKSLAKASKSKYIYPTIQPGHSTKSLLTSLQQSHLCLPALCYWDYSFYGLEAMAFGLPTAVDEESHLAHFVMKYLDLWADYCIVRNGEDKLSSKITQHLEQMPESFKKAKALKMDLQNCEAITQSFAKFASVLQGSVQKENQDGCKDQEEIDFSVKVALDEEMLQKRLRELEKQTKAVSVQLRQLQERKKNELKAAWGECEQGLKRRVQAMLADEDSCNEVKKVCKEKVGLDPNTLATKSLGILLKILTLYYLYRVKQTCISRNLAKALEPLLITDEMGEIAAKVEITLRLKATYDTVKFEEIELFFINRDGGGVQPVTFHSGTEENGGHANLDSKGKEPLLSLQTSDQVVVTASEQVVTASEQVDVTASEQVVVTASEQVDITASDQIDVPANEQVDVTASDQVNVMASEQVDVPASEQNDVPASEQVDVPASDQVNVTAIDQVDVMASEQVNVTACEDVVVTGSEQAVVTASEQVDVTASDQVDVWASDQVDVLASEQVIAMASELVDVTACEQVDVTASVQVDVPASEQVDVTASELVDVTASEQVDVTASVQVDVTASEQVDVTASELVDVTASEQAVVTASELVDVTASEQVVVTASVQVDVPASEQVDVTASELVDVTASEQVDVTASVQVDVTASEQVDVTASELVDVTASEQVVVTANEQAVVTASELVDVTASEQVVVTASDQVDVPATDQVDVPASGQVDVTANDQVDVMASEQVVVTASEQVDVTASEQVDITPSDQVGVPASEQVDVPASEQVDVMASEKLDVTPSDQVDVMASDQVDVTTSEQVDVTASEQVDVMASEQVDVRASDQVDVTASEHVDVLASEQVDVMASEKLDVTPSDQVDVMASDQVDIRTSEQVDVTACEQVDVMASEQVDVRASDQVDVTASEHVDVPASEQVDVMASEQLDVTPSDQVDVMASDQVDITASEQVDVTASEQVDVMANEQVDVRASDQVDVTASEQVVEQISQTKVEQKLEEQLIQYDETIKAAVPTQETDTRSLQPIKPSEQQLTDSDIRYLALAESKVQSLQSQLDISESKVESLQSKLEKACTEKKILETQLAEAVHEKSQLEKQCQEYMQLYHSAEKVVSTQLSDIHALTAQLERLDPKNIDNLLTKLQEKDKVITELKTKLSKLLDTQSDIGVKKIIAGSLQLSEHKEVTETSVDDVYSRTKIAEVEEEERPKPEMRVRDASEMGTATPTQPEMTVREGSEMETATPTQPEMIVREGSEMATATPIQPEMTGVEGHGIKTEMITTETKYLTEKKDSSGRFGKFFKRLVGRKDKPDERWSRRTLKGHQEHTGMFKDVKGLTFHNDKLLVCDQEDNIVHILNHNYTCEKELGSFSGQFAKPFQPVCIAVSQDNLYFILDNGNVQIVVCDHNNKVIRIVTLPTDSDPWCIAFVKGFVIVTDVKGDRALKYSQAGQYIAECLGSGQTRFDYPRFVAVNSRDVIMVSDCNNSCIKCFDAQLNFLYKYGHRGTGDSQLYFPHSIAIDGADHVYVCDRNNARISVWSGAGKWRRNLFQHEVIKPAYMAVTADGDRIAVRERCVLQCKLTDYRTDPITSQLVENGESNNCVYKIMF